MSGTRSSLRDIAERGALPEKPSPAGIRSSGVNRFSTTFNMDARVFGSGVVRESIEQNNGQSVHKTTYVKDGVVRTSAVLFNPLHREELVPEAVIASEAARPKKAALLERFKLWLRAR